MRSPAEVIDFTLLLVYCVFIVTLFISALQKHFYSVKTPLRQADRRFAGKKLEFEGWTRLTRDNAAVIFDRFYRCKGSQRLLLFQGKRPKLTQDLEYHSRADAGAMHEVN
jgi:hypothetical protein